MKRLVLHAILITMLLAGMFGCKQPTDEPGDLSIAMISTTVSVEEGTEFSFSYRITNNGSSSSSATTVSEYASTDTTLDGGDEFIRSVSIDPIASGQNFNVTDGAHTITPDGTYYIIVVVDPGDQITESDETNNRDTLLVDVQPAPNPGIDLTPGTPYYTGQVNNNDTVAVIVPVENLGDDAATAAFDVDLYLVTNSDLSPLPTATTQNVTTDVPGNGSIDVPISVTFTGFSDGDGVILYAEVDTGDAIVEIDETNNANTITTVGGKLIGAGPFSVRFETFATSGDVDTYLTIYEEGTPTALTNTSGGGSGSFAAYTDSFSSGTVLLVLVRGATSGGPYGFIARALNFSNPTNFTAVADAGSDPGEPDSGTDEASMTGEINLVVGGGMSRYTVASFADEDWFRVTIP